MEDRSKVHLIFKTYFIIIVNLHSGEIIEIADASNGDIKQITKSYKRLVKLRQERSQETPPATSSPDGVKTEGAASKLPVTSNKPKPSNKGSTAYDMLPRIAQKLNLQFQVLTNSQNLVNKAAAFLEGKHPNTIAAASLLFYLRTHKEAPNVYDKDVAKAANLAPSTMRSAYRVLEDNREALLNA